MFGVKINEFDNSDGKVATFNKIFPKTPLEVGDHVKYVEIGDIVEFKYISQGSPFIRELIFFDHNYVEIERINHDFGENNFVNNEDFTVAEKVRFKYFAKDLDGNVLAKGYSSQELATKMNCHVNVIKRRLVKPITHDDSSRFKFNVTRREI